MNGSLLPVAAMLLVKFGAWGSILASAPEAVGVRGRAPRRDGEARMRAILPDLRHLRGFREIPPGGEPPQNGPQPHAGHASGWLLKRYLRAPDGARLEIEVQQTFWAGSRGQQQAESEVQSAGGVLHTAFTGLPMGDWVRSTGASSGKRAVLAFQSGSWVVIARLEAGKNSSALTTGDRLLVENALRRVIAKPQRSPLAHDDVQVDYQLRGHPEKGLHLVMGIEHAPVAPIFRAAGLRVTESRQVPVVRGWRGERLVVTVAAGAREMVVEGRPERLPGERGVLVIDNQVAMSASDLAARLGLCTYLEVPVTRGRAVPVGMPGAPTPIFHVDTPTAPRPLSIVHLVMPHDVPPDPPMPRSVRAVAK